MQFNISSTNEVPKIWLQTQLLTQVVFHWLLLNKHTGKVKSHHLNSPEINCANWFVSRQEHWWRASHAACGKRQLPFMITLHLLWLSFDKREIIVAETVWGFFFSAVISGLPPVNINVSKLWIVIFFLCLVKPYHPTSSSIEMSFFPVSCLPHYLPNNSWMNKCCSLN